MSNALGIDVSAWQQTTPSLAGKSFLVARATYGTFYDGMYTTHIANAKRAGLVTGAYHFGRGSQSVSAQVTAFLASAKRAAVDFLVLDLESDGASAAMTPMQAKACIAGVKAADSRPLLLYHSLSGWPGFLGQDANWVAAWIATAPTINWRIWQYQGSPLDLDQFNGDTTALRAFVTPFSGGTVQGVPDVDAKTEIPAAVCDIAAGGTMYADEARTTVLVQNWAGGTAVGLYARPSTPKDATGRANLAFIRVNMASATAPDIRGVYIGDDKISNVRVPGAVAGYTQAQLDAAVAAQAATDAATLAAVKTADAATLQNSVANAVASTKASALAAITNHFKGVIG